MIKLAVQGGKKSGGPGIFMDRLLRYMEDREMVKVVESDYDILFATVWLEPPSKPCKIVYRAASIYYDDNEQSRGKSTNRKLANAVRLADHTIYQSKFAERLFRKILKVRAKQHTIIHNGFDANAYTEIAPAVLKAKNAFIACASWGRALKRGNLLVKSFLDAKVPDSCLYMIGPETERIQADYRPSDRLIYTGRVPSEEIVAMLKAGAYGVVLSHAEACPNAAVEAISFGRPVLCNNIGGTPEVVGESGIVCSCDRRFEFHRHRVDLSMKNYESVLAGYREIVSRSWDIKREDLTMEHCAKQYLTVFESVLS